MPGNEPTSESNLDGYGAPQIEWTRVRAVLDGEITQAPGTGGPGRHTAWLTTSNTDGTPHVMPLGVISVAGAWYFNSRPVEGVRARHRRALRGYPIRSRVAGRGWLTPKQGTDTR
jgi:hypothetical protein